MSKKLFTEKEIKKLSKNPYVKSVSSKGITYTDEFKELFVSQYKQGKTPREIFRECGFDEDIIGLKRIQSSRDRWRNSYHQNGVIGLRDARTGNSGRPRERELSIEERYERLEAETNLLKAENELLKKIQFAERGLKKK